MTFSPRWYILPLRMRRTVAFMGIILILSVKVHGVPVGVDVPAEIASEWARFISSHPFPPDLSDAGGAGAPTNEVLFRDNPQPGSRIVAVSALVPVIRLWDSPVALTRARVQAGTVRLLPLESVSLPDFALPVDGLYPGDPGYPLVRRFSAAIRGDDPRLRSWFDALPDLSTDESPRRIRWIGAVGDIMPSRGVDSVLLASAGQERVFGDTLPTLSAVDLLVGNLEAAATTRGAKTTKTYTFRFDPRALGSLAAAGFSYLSLANNHTFDYGVEGFLDTLAGLAQAGIATSGAGRTAEAASRPAVLKIGEMEIRLLSFADYPVDRAGFDGRVAARATAGRPGTLWLDDEGIAAAARGFSAHAFNIALVHGGVEWSTVPTEAQRRDYERLVHAGADLVVGSHPHVLQGLEALDGKLIAYSLGNFLFPGMEGTSGGERSLILEVGVYDRRIIALRFAPVQLRGGTVRLDPQPGALDDLRARSLRLSPPAGNMPGLVPLRSADGVQ
jgi:poly-gamma-glutamate capsule biosynthesis protein CapA/YwtB (metallophosphatase superfamily)